MRRAAILIYGGSLAVVLALLKVHATSIGHYDLTGSSRFAWAFAYVGLICLAAYGVGVTQSRRFRSAAAAAAKATGLGAASISVVQTLVGSALLPRFVVLSAPLVLVPWYGLSMAATAKGTEKARRRVRAVIVIDPGEALTLADDIARCHDPVPVVVSTLDVGAARARAGPIGPLAAAAESERATVVVLGREAYADEWILNQASHLHASGTRVRTLDRFYDEWLHKLPLGELGPASLLFDIGELHSHGYNRSKRIVDAVLGLMGSVVLVAFMPIVAAGNLLANRGPLFYTQPRVGKNGRRFSMYKFRTMRPDPAAGLAGGEWTEQGDQRITPFGRWMRRTHLDELPQVLNILKGDLATVGPRPEQPHYVAELAGKIPFYNLRHLVRPGLTGWAQVNYGYGSTDVDAMEKLQYEFYYLRHQGLALDARIIARTIRSVMGATGR